VAAKERVIAFALGRRREGLTWSAIADELGIPFETLRCCWLTKRNKSPESGSRPSPCFTSPKSPS
jgi:orotate phosphoribosyltransferase-like protein